MSEIRKYVLVSADDSEYSNEYDESEYLDAVREAARLGCAVIARVYEYSDSELIWTPDGGSIWPPKQAKE